MAGKPIYFSIQYMVYALLVYYYLVVLLLLVLPLVVVVYFFGTGNSGCYVYFEQCVCVCFFKKKTVCFSTHRIKINYVNFFFRCLFVCPPVQFQPNVHVLFMLVQFVLFFFLDWSLYIHKCICVCVCQTKPCNRLIYYYCYYYYYIQHTTIQHIPFTISSL